MSNSMSVWDYLVFLGMLLISAALGIYYALVDGGQSTATDFLMAGRQLSAAPVALSLTASFMSAITVLGTPAEVYRFGAIFLLFGITYVLVVVITSEIYMPVFYRLGLTSTYEYLELRFNKQVRLLGTVLFIVQTILYTGIVIYAPALALSQVTGFELWGAVVTTGVVCTFYCSLGGLRAVVWTDVIQAFIMVAGFSSIIIQTSNLQGGLKTIIRHAKEGGRLRLWDFNPSPLQRHTFWTITIGGTFTWTSIYGVNQSQVQRYLACKTRFQAKLALYLNLLGLWIILTCAVFCGLSLYSVYRNCDPWTSHKISAPDQLMPYLAVEILSDHPGLPGLFVACAYSGTLSTVSSSINALAAVTVEDLIKPHLNSPSQKTLSLFSKGTSLFYGILCIGMAALASLMGSLLQAALSIFGMIGGPLLGLFTLGILNPFANSLGSFIGLISGFSFSMWIGVGAHFYPPPPERMLPLPLSVANCTVTRSTHLDWIRFPEQLFLMPWRSNDFKRTPVMDNLYSLSYLYLSALGTLTTVFVGTIFSLLTGGKEQHVDSKYMLNVKEDMTLGNFKKI
ncbi:sodium-coupled monocarboxylate transporter 1-like [Dromiciops gliroides]|uniref:sodium-coupled monocarboxylate transporter 1-like n=1 Tax=Dromiciops gliroides TaxID=33562 RepID=UPI001CC668ED|nr:sodium-coupled monocarboxylate transporter 1-like [Dromiciops gliroides]